MKLSISEIGVGVHFDVCVTGNEDLVAYLKERYLVDERATKFYLPSEVREDPSIIEGYRVVGELPFELTPLPYVYGTFGPQQEKASLEELRADGRLRVYEVIQYT